MSSITAKIDGGDNIVARVSAPDTIRAIIGNALITGGGGGQIPELSAGSNSPVGTVPATNPHLYIQLTSPEWTIWFFSGSTWQMQSDTGKEYLSQLLDVNIPSPSNGEVLTYNGTSGKWEADLLKALHFTSQDSSIAIQDVTIGNQEYVNLSWNGLTMTGNGLNNPTDAKDLVVGAGLSASANGAVVTLTTTGSTTNTLTNPVNTITSTVNGVVATAPAVNTVSNSIVGALLTTTVNGQSSVPVTIPTGGVTSVTLTNPTNTITVGVDGLTATANAVNTVSNSVSTNNLTTTVNGVGATAVQLVSSVSNTSAGNNLTTTVNGVTGSAVTMVNSVSNSSVGNNLSTTINGITGTQVPIVNSVANTINGTQLTTTVNGVSGAPVTLPAGSSITLTTNNENGPATLINNVLNIPDGIGRAGVRAQPITAPGWVSSGVNAGFAAPNSLVYQIPVPSNVSNIFSVGQTIAYNSAGNDSRVLQAVIVNPVTQHTTLEIAGADWNSNNFNGQLLYIFGTVSNQFAEVDEIDFTNFGGTYSTAGGRRVYTPASGGGGGADIALRTAEKEPTGFPDPTRTQTTISFNNGTRTFEITPTGASFDVWVAGTQYTKAVSESIQIPNTSGLYYIAYNTAGQLVQQTTYFVWDAQAPVAYIYWNATDGLEYFFADERHGTTMDWATHEYLHRTRGAAYANGYTISGTTTGTGNVSTDAQIGMSAGTFFDEDIQIDYAGASLPAPVSVFYRFGTTWKSDTSTGYPYKIASTTAGYNLNSSGSWSVADLGNNKYGSMWLCATNDSSRPLIAIMGQQIYDNQAEAESSQWESLDLSGLPIFEIRPLYNLVFITGTNYTNAVKAATRVFVDWRSATGLQLPEPTFDAVDIAFRETPQTVFANDPTASAAWLGFVDGEIANKIGSVQSGIQWPPTLSRTIFQIQIDYSVPFDNYAVEIRSNTGNFTQADVDALNAIGSFSIVGNLGDVILRFNTPATWILNGIAINNQSPYMTTVIGNQNVLDGNANYLGLTVTKYASIWEFVGNNPPLNNKAWTQLPQGFVFQTDPQNEIITLIDTYSGNAQWEGNGITGTINPQTVAIGNNMTGAFSGGTLTLSATGAGTSVVSGQGISITSGIANLTTALPRSKFFVYGTRRLVRANANSIAVNARIVTSSPQSGTIAFQSAIAGATQDQTYYIVSDTGLFSGIGLYDTGSSSLYDVFFDENFYVSSLSFSSATVIPLTHAHYSWINYVNCWNPAPTAFAGTFTWTVPTTPSQQFTGTVYLYQNVQLDIESDCYRCVPTTYSSVGDCFFVAQSTSTFVPGEFIVNRADTAST